ncbi:hypothetical protein DERF_013224 [Dermatophagoides farinae]|uniref:Uncharacterized protein n=1 Tax=Dermatophagoides farinae TaxID=6954 RepID=A0A922L242_DERFA|nr:hypothetical protein DERF_013224 [Dermatophagoides farinae]
MNGDGDDDDDDDCDDEVVGNALLETPIENQKNVHHKSDIGMNRFFTEYPYQFFNGVTRKCS